MQNYNTTYDYSETDDKEKGNVIGGIGIMLVTTAFLFINGYHLHNWLFNLYKEPDSMNLFAHFIALIAFSAAFGEIFATRLMVNAWRIDKSIIMTLIYASVVGLVMFFEVQAGMASQTSIYDHKNSVITSELQSIDNLDTKLANAEAKRQAAYALAERYDGAMKEVVKKSADAKFLEAKADINDLRAEMTMNKTSAVHVVDGKTATDEQMLILFPLFLSVMAVVMTIYSMLHVAPVLRLAAMSMENKINQSWSSKSIEEQNHKLTVSPMKGTVTESTGFELIKKVLPSSKEMKEKFVKSVAIQPNQKALDADAVKKPENKTINHYGMIISRVFNDDHTMIITAREADGSVMKFKGLDGTLSDDISVPSWSERNYVNDNPKSEITGKINQLIKKMREVKATNAIELKPVKVDAIGKDSVNDSATKPAQKVAKKVAQDAPKKEGKIDNPAIGFQVSDNRPTPSNKPLKKVKSTEGSVKSTEGSVSLTQHRTEGSVRKSTEGSVKAENKAIFEQMIKRVGEGKTAKIGEIIPCVNCGKNMKKRAEVHKYCSTNKKPRSDGGNCSDDYNNFIKNHK